MELVALGALGIAGLCGLWLWVTEQKAYGHFLGMGMLFYGFHLLYTLLPAFSHLAMYDSTATVILRFIVISALSGLCFVASYFSVISAVLSPRVGGFPKTCLANNDRGEPIGSIGVLLVVWLLALFLVTAIAFRDAGGVGTYFLSSYSERVAVESTAFELALRVWQISGICLVIGLVRDGALRRIIVLALAILVISLLIGKRRPVIEVLIPAVVVLLNRRQVASISIAVLGVIGFMFFQSVNYLRGVFTFQKSLSDVLGSAGWVELFSFYSGETKVVLRNFLLIVNHGFEVAAPGITYLHSLVLLIPSGVVNRPLSVGQKLTLQHAPELHQTGGGLAFGAVNEAYVNFGSFGFLVYIVLGFIIGFLTVLLSSVRFNSWVYCFVVSILVPSTVLFHRAAFASFLKSVEVYVFCFVVVVVLYYVLKWLRRPLGGVRSDPSIASE